MTMTDEREAVGTAQHTPGPWGCVRYGGPEEFEIQADHRKLAIVNSRQRVEERGVVRFEPGPFSEAEALANARLIAAAPALLGELEAILDDYADALGEERYERACTAIRVARGEV